MSLGNGEYGVSDSVAHICYLPLITIQKVRASRQDLKWKVFVAVFGHGQCTFFRDFALLNLSSGSYFTVTTDSLA